MITKDEDGYWFTIDPPDGGRETYGPYGTKKEAECDARGIKQFYSLNEKELREWKKN